MGYLVGLAGRILRSAKLNSTSQVSTKTSNIAKLRNQIDEAHTPDIMDGLGNQFTARVIRIINENGGAESINHPSFRTRVDHEKASLGRVAILVEPLDWPTHILLPEVTKAGGAERKGYFNIWEENLPVCYAVSSDLPTPPIGSRIRVTVDGTGDRETYWYTAVLDDKVTAPFIEPPASAKDSFKPCPPGFHCGPPAGDPINTEGAPWGYAASKGSPQSGLLQKAIVNCAKYRSYQLPAGKGVVVEEFASAADTSYTGLNSPKAMRKQLLQHGFSYVILGVAFYGSQSSRGPATTSFLEPYIKELLAHRIKPFLMAELFGGAAESQSAQMVDDLIKLVEDTGAAGIITRVRSVGPNNPGWTPESAQQHAADLDSLAYSRNISVGLMGPGMPELFPELSETLDILLPSVNYVLPEIAPNATLTTKTAIEIVLQETSNQWSNIGYDFTFPVYPAFGPGFEKVPASVGVPEKSNMAPGQSMPPGYFKNFAELSGMSEGATINDTTMAISDWANLDAGSQGEWSTYNWASNRWDIIKTITNVWPKTEEQARERGLPAYLSEEGPLVFLPPTSPVNSPSGFSRPYAVLTGSSKLDFKGPKPPAPPPPAAEEGQIQAIESGEDAPVDTNIENPTPAVDNQDEASPQPGATPQEVTTVGDLQGANSCTNALGRTSRFFPEITDNKQKGRFYIPNKLRIGGGVIDSTGNNKEPRILKKGAYEYISPSGEPPAPKQWPTSNGKPIVANAHPSANTYKPSGWIKGTKPWQDQNIIWHRNAKKRLSRSSTLKKKDEAAGSSDNVTADIEDSESRYANPCEMFGGLYVGRTNAWYVHEFRTIFEVACRVSGYTPGQYVSEQLARSIYDAGSKKTSFISPKLILSWSLKGSLIGPGGKKFKPSSAFFKYKKYYNLWASARNDIWSGNAHSQMGLGDWMSEKSDMTGHSFYKTSLKKIGLSKANTMGEFVNKFDGAYDAYVNKFYHGGVAKSTNARKFAFSYSWHASGCAYDVCPAENSLGSKAGKAIHKAFKNPTIWKLTGGFFNRPAYYYSEGSQYHGTYGTKQKFLEMGGGYKKGSYYGTAQNAMGGASTAFGSSGTGGSKYDKQGKEGDNFFKVFAYKDSKYSIDAGNNYKTKVKSTLEDILTAPGAPSIDDLLPGLAEGGSYYDNLVDRLNEWSMASNAGYVFFARNGIQGGYSDVWVVKRSIPLSGVRQNPVFWQTFIRAGWNWGGMWTGCFKDDHHFSRKQIGPKSTLQALAGRGPYAENNYPFMHPAGTCDFTPIPFKDLKTGNMINPTKTLLPIKDGAAWHPSYEVNFDSDYIYIHGIGNFPRDPSSPHMISTASRVASTNPVDPANYEGVEFA